MSKNKSMLQFCRIKLGLIVLYYILLNIHYIPNNKNHAIIKKRDKNGEGVLQNANYMYT